MASHCDYRISRGLKDHVANPLVEQSCVTARPPIAAATEILKCELNSQKITMTERTYWAP
ncbi:hypothetical protein GCM10010971_26550 [Silvimonas amylolytica]|uniref:Flavin reductase like domain-containing protein n=1 Tax=Silvimonas amylolytica TaxID=449663 RepID=A0ABQ2PNE6_9NEIS|nr:hypothetical protein GCM10010971_26550 [Silvimonas amylolytica]